MKIISIKCPSCGANTNLDEERGFGYCSFCGTKIVSGEHVYVHHVNSEQKQETPPQQNYTYVTNNYYTNEQPNRSWEAVSEKSRTAALLLCLFFGYLGVHHFYAGRIGLGILYLFTGGLFIIGAIVDFVMIIAGTFKDSNGREIKRW